MRVNLFGILGNIIIVTSKLCLLLNFLPNTFVIQVLCILSTTMSAHTGHGIHPHISNMSNHSEININPYGGTNSKDGYREQNVLCRQT